MSVESLSRFAVYHRNRNPPRSGSGHEGGRLFDGLFVVYAFTREAAEKAVRDRMGDDFNEAVVIPLLSSDKSGVELEFWYEPPSRKRK